MLSSNCVVATHNTTHTPCTSTCTPHPELPNPLPSATFLSTRHKTELAKWHKVLMCCGVVPACLAGWGFHPYMCLFIFRKLFCVLKGMFQPLSLLGCRRESGNTWFTPEQLPSCGEVISFNADMSTLFTCVGCCFAVTHGATAHCNCFYQCYLNTPLLLVIYPSYHNNIHQCCLPSCYLPGNTPLLLLLPTSATILINIH